jgi:predicted TIM-barrel fold metal-dependent hydrolase
MKIIDVHSHWPTRRGFPLRTEQELAQQRNTWNSEPRYMTEWEMAEYFTQNNARAVLDFGFAKFLPLEEMQALHDYAFATQREIGSSLIGHWIHIDPHKSGAAGVKELRRCIDEAPSFIGFAVSSSGTAPASDEAFDPYYRLCIEAGIPALIFVGTTGLGAGLPGGGGIILDNCHPRHLDFVAATYPDLKIVAARPGWPWQAETIAVLMHKRNIWYELHGWSPKYFTHELKHDISRRLQDRVMFGADIPLYTYERLVADWNAEGYSEEILEKVFWRNANNFLGEGDN